LLRVERRNEALALAAELPASGVSVLELRSQQPETDLGGPTTLLIAKAVPARTLAAGGLHQVMRELERRWPGAKACTLRAFLDGLQEPPEAEEARGRDNVRHRPGSQRELVAASLLRRPVGPDEARSVLRG
jgi:hypothetical protein